MKQLYFYYTEAGELTRCPVQIVKREGNFCLVIMEGELTKVKIECINF